MRSRRSAQPHPPRGQTKDRADELTIWSIRLLIGGALVREALGQSKILVIGSYDVHSLDPAVVVALLAAAAHLAKRRLDWRPYTIPILIIAGLIGINFLRGIISDPGPALLSVRANASIATMLVLAVSMRTTATVMQSARHALLLCCIGLGVLVLLRLATYPSLFMTVDRPDAMINDGGRPLSAQGSFLMVLASGIVTAQILQRRRLVMDYMTAAAAILPLLVLLTRQGTASLAEFAVLATVIVLQRGHSQGRRLLWAGLAVPAVFALLAWVLPIFLDSEDFLRRTKNIGTRQEIWRSLMASWPGESLFVQLFGYPAGQQPMLMVLWSDGYRDWTNSIHSMYFGALPIMGYLGAIAYVSMLIMLIGTALKGTLRKQNPLPATPLALCLATAVLSCSYEMRNDALIALLFAIAMLRQGCAYAPVRPTQMGARPTRQVRLPARPARQW